MGARGPLLQGARTGRLPWARLPAGEPAPRPRGIRQARHGGARRVTRGGGHRGGAVRTTQAHLQHPPQDAAQERRAGRDLRHPCRAGARRQRARLLRRPRRGPCAMAADPGPVRRLHRDAQEQRLPEPPYRGRGRGRQAARGPDPDPRDASHLRGGYRGPLALQGRLAHRPRLRRQAGLAAPAHGLAAGGLRRDRVRGGRQARHLPGPGVRVHAPRRRQGPARRRHTPRLRLSHPYRRRVTRASAPRSTTGWCRSTTSSRTATSSRS